MVTLPTNIDVEASWRTLETETGYTQQHSGLQLWKTADDLRRYRTVIEETRPEVVVETGTRWGGFAAWIADTFGAEVVTVDIERTEGRPNAWPGVTYVLGDSAAPAVIGQVRELVAGRRTMVSLDAEHAAPHVAAEIRGYGPLVSTGCYLVVEDGIADLLSAERACRLGHRIPKEGGPLHAIRRQLMRRPGWQRDRGIEDISRISHHPAGWWIRTAS